MEVEHLHLPQMFSFSWERIRLQCKRPQIKSWVGKICWRRDRLPTPVFLGFPCGSAGKESACNAGDLGWIPGSEDPLEKEMAIHASILDWKIPWKEERGRLQSLSTSLLNSGAQTHIHRVGDAIQPSHPPLSPSPLAPNPSQHQSL